MIYLAIDTDVWLWLIIHGIDTEDNFFDEICFWLENGRVRCIVPQHIVAEWERHKDAKIAYVKTELNKANQLKKTATIQNTELFNSVYNADNFEALGRARINKVEEIFEKYTEIALVDEAIKLHAADRTLARLAPSHSKDSYSDTVNILAVLALVRDMALSPVIFTSKNYKDYSDPVDRIKIHADLLPFLEEVNMEYAYDTDYLFNKILRPQLPSFSEFIAQNKLKKERESVLADQQQRDRLANSDEDFIGNSLMVDQILEQGRPTKYHFKFINDLISGDENIRKYFFEKVSKPVWFAFLEENDFLDPAQHPGPINSPQGAYLSHWQPLGYLERLAGQIKNGQNQEMTAPLLDLIKKISLAKIDNDITHTALIRILSNLPNSEITLDILEFIPGWFSSTTNKMFPTSAICSYLLPKFIHDQANIEDVKKGEAVLIYLLGVSKIGIEIDNTPEKSDTSYYANGYPWVLTETLVKKDLLINIAKLCSVEVFYRLAKTLKLVLLDYPNGLHLPVTQGEATFEVKISVEPTTLLFSLMLPGKSEEFSSERIIDFDRLKENELKTAVIMILGKLGLTYEPTRENDDRLRGLVFALTVDRLSRAGATPIAEMDINHFHSKHFRTGYGILLSKYLSAITVANPQLAREISLTLFNDHKYRLPFFKRIVLHNLSIHFDSQRELFSMLLTPLDPERIFDDYTYRPDLFNLLKNNQHRFNAAEINQLTAIIDAGPPLEKDPDGEKKSHWQFRWYLAMNQLSPFKELYKVVGEAHQLQDRDVDPTQTMRFRSGTVSPMSIEQFLEMGDQAMVAYLSTFNPKDRWEEPNINGLAEILKQSVIRQPVRFLQALDLFLPVSYIHVYHLFYGLLEVGRTKPNEFDWKSLIYFCRNYIEQRDFDSDSRIIKSDSWNADKHWVLGVIAYQVSEICKQDDYVRQHNLLPVCRETVLLMHRHFVIPEIEEEPQHKDYPSHSLNSDNGKFLRACLDYCLCDVRVNKIKPPAFDTAFQKIFDDALIGQGMDAYILIGFYWQYFNYLNKNWLLSKLKDLQNTSEANWKAFMGGFLFATAPSNKKILDLMMPHYKKAVFEKLELKATGTNGLANHFTALYFWGMLDLSADSVMVGYLTGMPVKAINDLLHTLFFNEKYFETLKVNERLGLENRVIGLVVFIHNLYQDSIEPEIIEMRRSTVNIIHLIHELNENNTKAIKEGIALGTKQYHSHDLFGRLHFLMKAGKEASSAKHLAEILDLMMFVDHVHLMEDDIRQLSEMIQFLYDQQQRIKADTLCNRLSKAGQVFAKELFFLNNK